MVRSEGMSLKNLTTPPGIDPGTVRLVAQRLNHYATPGPFYLLVVFLNHVIKRSHYKSKCRSQWPRGLSRRSSAARLLRSWVRIPPRAWMCVCCDCCVLSGRGLCDELITRPEKSYRLWRVVVCDQETSKTRRLKPATGL
jgi:hypothetical protein